MRKVAIILTIVLALSSAGTGLLDWATAHARNAAPPAQEPRLTPTDVPQDTPEPPPATDTPAPAPTNTPVRPTSTSAAPTATPKPAKKPSGPKSDGPGNQEPAQPQPQPTVVEQAVAVVTEPASVPTTGVGRFVGWPLGIAGLALAGLLVVVRYLRKRSAKKS